MKVIEAAPVIEELITIEEFLALNENDRNAFKSIRIVPPRIDQEGFGKMLVVRKNPVYRREIKNRATRYSWQKNLANLRQAKLS